MQAQDLLKQLTEHLDHGRQMGDELNRLKGELDQIKHELSEIKRGGTDEGWMALKQAATRIGLSTDALAQRFRRGIYPEGVVWRKEGNPDNPKCRYLVHLASLRRHMSTQVN